jgi:septal ring factor EnvC (AmiA/AmiB activator)
MIAPAQGRISQGFTTTHKAVDIVNAYRSPIVAPEQGTITAVGQMGSGTSDAGLVVQIGNTSSRAHRLCHLDSYIVKVGQKVIQGQVVGYMGYTGYTTPSGIGGTHLHWVMWNNGVRVDGRNYITNKGGNEVFQNTTEVQQAYQMLRGRNATAAEAQSWVGQSRQRFFVVAKPEADGYRTHAANLQTQVNNLSKQVADLAKSVTALTAEVNKLKTQNTEMEKAIKIKDNEITRLNKELESCGGSQNNSDISHIREVVDKIWAKISSIFK